MPFAERDWKHLRSVHEPALQRFCTRVLADAAAIIQRSETSAHERYLQLSYLLHDRNDEMATAFDDLRRSTGLQRLIAMVGLDVVSREELAGFSPDVQKTAHEMSRLLSPRRKSVRRGR